MKAPAVSVIMPAYNHEKFIGEAIHSVLNQSFSDFELIIVNDGSTDGTEDAIRSFDDPRIAYYSQENADAYNAINRGLALATGDYIAIINSDDIYHQDRLADLVEAANERDGYFIITNLRFIDENSRVITDASHPWIVWHDHLLETFHTTHSLVNTFMEGNIAVTTSNFFFSRKIKEEIGQFRPYRYAHDYDYVLRAMQRYPNNFLFLRDKHRLSYRLHGTNTIRETPIKLNAEVFDILLTNISEPAHEWPDSSLGPVINALRANRADLIHIEDARLREKVLIIQEQTAQIDDDKLAIAELRTRQDELNTQLRQAEKTSQDVFNSMSWRLTRPMRWLSRTLRRWWSG